MMKYNVEVYRKDSNKKVFYNHTLAENINDAINKLILGKDFNITKLKSFWQKDQLLAIINCTINGIDSRIVIHCYL